MATDAVAAIIYWSKVEWVHLSIMAVSTSDMHFCFYAIYIKSWPTTDALRGTMGCTRILKTNNRRTGSADCVQIS